MAAHAAKVAAPAAGTPMCARAAEGDDVTHALADLRGGRCTAACDDGCACACVLSAAMPAAVAAGRLAALPRGASRAC
eukprot:352655-Chlamydomonas_euryale.AAC.3